MLKSLDEIDNYVKKGTITQEQGKEYSHLIKSRTDELLGMVWFLKKSRHRAGIRPMESPCLPLKLQNYLATGEITDIIN
ncbi:hypothetical protein Dfer_1927 [Dyadobacter fermentans DSM 18053]|uniref:Uncharacterized protein n=1 Tax=Dyadobacter fermentans (strain ATCC 700827 / DSM 18053 / CIP 107007 / KCTC 52180 / NS114) TaxID=471854 RepID=C6VW22_DYAFD|nr:hypothetical protein Dfer_1927 [Dyadobacter fermentans DSM 18053]